jgi:hypothetical protein
VKVHVWRPSKPHAPGFGLACVIQALVHIHSVPAAIPATFPVRLAMCTYEVSYREGRVDTDTPPCKIGTVYTWRVLQGGKSDWATDVHSASGPAEAHSSMSTMQPMPPMPGGHRPPADQFRAHSLFLKDLESLWQAILPVCRIQTTEFLSELSRITVAGFSYPARASRSQRSRPSPLRGALQAHTRRPIASV